MEKVKSPKTGPMLPGQGQKCHINIPGLQQASRRKEDKVMRVVLLLFLTLLFSFPVQAANHRDHQGTIYKGTPGAEEMTVAQARNMPDDTYVILTGNLVSKVGDETYIFRDRSGEIRVEIDDKYFRGLEIGPNDTVRITGEVDKDFGKNIEIDVKQMLVITR